MIFGWGTGAAKIIFLKRGIWHFNQFYTAIKNYLPVCGSHFKSVSCQKKLRKLFFRAAAGMSRGAAALWGEKWIFWGINTTRAGADFPAPTRPPLFLQITANWFSKSQRENLRWIALALAVGNNESLISHSFQKNDFCHPRTLNQKSFFWKAKDFKLILPAFLDLSPLLRLFNFAGAKNSRAAPAKLNGEKRLLIKTLYLAYLIYRKATLPF